MGFTLPWEGRPLLRSFQASDPDITSRRIATIHLDEAGEGPLWLVLRTSGNDLRQVGW